MKKIFAIIGAALFMLGFGIAYAGSALNNGVTDFSGKTYDSLEIAAAGGAVNVHEGSAAGGLRQNCGSEESSVVSYDSLPISVEVSGSKMTKGSAAGLHGNCGSEKSSVRTYDSVPMVW